ncbi:hypothetical protein [Streptomyces albus]|uniref:hypothetical protein n=1 Tax=Streptomyces albus TaxID=1888 RepID=UPI003F4D24FE
MDVRSDGADRLSRQPISTAAPTTANPTRLGRVTRVDARHRQESNAYDESGNQTSANWPADHAKPEARGPRHCTGLHYNCFRHHDPRTARYLSPDPWAWPRHSTR